MTDTSPATAAPQRSPDLTWLAALACLIVAFAVYAPALRNAFFNDDALWLNAAGRVAEHPASLLSERPLGYFRPVYLAWFAAQRMLFGLQPVGYYASGIVLHGLIGFGVFLLGRRVIGREDGALIAAVSYIGLFGHSEAVLWISAQNSALVCGLAVAALLAHLRAQRLGGLGPALVTMLLVAAALATKETGIVVLGWLGLAELWDAGRAPRGERLRRLDSGGLVVRWVPILVVTVAFIAASGQLGEALSGDAAGEGTRRNLRFISVERLLGTAAWNVSPMPYHDIAGFLLPGLAVILATLGLAAWRGKLGTAALCWALWLVAVLPTCMTRVHFPNGTRLFDFATVGTALVVGLMVALPKHIGSRRLAAVAVLAGLLLHAKAIHRSNEEFYRPLSVEQTAAAEQLDGLVAGSPTGQVFLLEPWIDNLAHLQQFAWLYAGIEPGRITRIARPTGTGAAAALLDRVDVFDWVDGTGFVRAERFPEIRERHRGGSVVPAASQRRAINVYRIAPEAPGR